MVKDTEEKEEEGQRPWSPPVGLGVDGSRVYGPEESQQVVFGDVCPLLTSLIDGYNVCIMAYGQTGCGKSYTMLGPHSKEERIPPWGPHSDLGIMPRAAGELFRLIAENPSRRLQVDLSIVEVYNNNIFDLLAKACGMETSGRRREALTTKDARREVPLLTREPVHSAEDFVALAAGSLRLRAELATLVHARSSRSHLIITATLTTGPAACGSPGFPWGLGGSETHCGMTSVRACQVPVITERVWEHPSASWGPSRHQPHLRGQCTALRPSPSCGRPCPVWGLWVGGSTLWCVGPWGEGWSFSRGKLREASWTSFPGMCHPLAADQQAEGPPLEGQPASGSRGGASCGRASAGSLGAQQPMEQVHAKLQLVDLAGSECAGVSGVTGSALRETSFINRSLAALADVLGALSERRGHIPYRNSQLTHFLQDVLGGDAKLLVMLCVSPCRKHVAETLRCLGFGARARQVQRGQANGGSLAPRKPR
uniref:kinesin-like protein KIF25 n=1 Tax=Nyctereutes procyonoides TaxID=34880 RepID=UPI002443E4BE|nr:kinesin-like protein KIF25 [Nyctereutes procyonoides]